LRRHQFGEHWRFVSAPNAPPRTSPCA
jgi:hypothetical protein